MTDGPALAGKGMDTAGGWSSRHGRALGHDRRQRPAITVVRKACTTPGGGPRPRHTPTPATTSASAADNDGSHQIVRPPRGSAAVSTPGCAATAIGRVQSGRPSTCAGSRVTATASRTAGAETSTTAPVPIGWRTRRSCPASPELSRPNASSTTSSTGIARTVRRCLVPLMPLPSLTLNPNGRQPRCPLWRPRRPATPRRRLRGPIRAECRSTADGPRNARIRSWR